ncbi:hypothetical protein QQ045_002771 [Rhodiola kirilowii]
MYAPSSEKEKLKLWEDIVSVKESSVGEWIIGGDFNSVLLEEERSRSIFNEKDAYLFLDFVQAMGVLDLPLRGRRFTWSNKSGASRLDRFLLSPGILSSWPKISQEGLSKGPSDHAAVSLGEEDKNWGIKPFRILNAWLDNPGLKGRIKNSWMASEESGWKGFTIQRKLSRVRRLLSLWNKKDFGDVRVKLSNSKADWERLSLIQESRSLSDEESLKKLALQKLIWQLEIQEERIWRQKSRISWLKSGDQNTKYFHRQATWRSKRNSISRLCVGEEWIEEPARLKQAAREYFSAIFKRSVTCQWSLDELNFRVLNSEQRDFLERGISEEEILAALKDCDGNKAPGPDGFNVNFFKKFWLIVGDELVGFIKEFCRNGRLSRGINKTFLALIPKTTSPQSFGDFRPISLVNSSYKILSKCLAKRLSLVLPLLISPNQTAFISNRNILVGIMITNEIIHSAKRERKRALVIKIDFKKAYDTISWEYLRSVLECMGFGSKWIKWVSECFSTPSLSVLINGSPSKEFPMERGLRQGDPLSPFLFLLAAEGLSRMLSNAVRAGLEINFGKSICIGIGISEEEVQGLAGILGCPSGSFPLTYLGMQVGSNPGRLATWSPILQKFKLKLASWRSANLSMAGRVVLIKSALCNLPLYYASMYKMPIAVAQEMEKIQRQFLWGSCDLRRKLHYVK